MNELEKYCLEEIDAVEEATFMYLLHECGIFDEVKFFQFISTVNELANQYIEDGKTKYYEDVTSGIVDCFSYIMLMFYCHLDTNDVFVIENYDDIKDAIPMYFDEMRNTTRSLITITNSKPIE